MNDPDSQRILLRMRDTADRRLLAEWLADESAHTPVVAESNEALDEAFDLCIVDAGTVEDAGAAIESRRRTEPTFLPCLLLVPQRSGADANEVLTRLADRDAAVVDEVVATPIKKHALAQRLETLFRMRTLSQQLNDSRNRYHRLLEVLPESVLVVRDGTVEYVNRAGLSLLDRAEPSILGTDLVDLVPPEERNHVEHYLQRVRDGDRPEFRETAVQTGDGETVPVELGGVRLVEDDDADPAVQVVIRDRHRESRPDWNPSRTERDDDQSRE